MCTGVMSVGKTMHCVHTSSMQARREHSRTGVTDTSEPICGWWELNTGLLEEQVMFFTGELSLYHLIF